MNGKLKVNNKDLSEMHFKNTMDEVILKKYHFSFLSLGNCLIDDFIFEQCSGYELGMKEAELRNTRILQSKIESCYLRHAKFTDCKLIGSKIINCNLEKANFKNCNFNYVQFENSLLNIDNLLENKPKEPNLKLFFVKQLYKNELQIGNSDQYDKLLFLIRDTEKEILKELWLNTDEYFKEKSKNRCLDFFKWILYICSKILFGYGLKFQRILLSYIMWIIIFIFIYFYIYNISLMNSFELSLQNSLLSNISILDSKSNFTIRSIGYIQNFIGIIYIAVLTSAFYRRIAR